MHKDIYQKLYDRGKYGNPEIGRCPGVRMFPLYKHWLVGKTVFDWGCGNGATLKMIAKYGFLVKGIDQIKNDLMGITQGDITEKQNIYGKVDVSLCLDVLEHILENKLNNLFENIMRSKRQILSVNNRSCVKHGVELHCNIKTFEEWERIISNYTEIKEKIKYDDWTMLYLCERDNEN